MKNSLFLLLFALLVAASASIAHAQVAVELGPRLGYDVGGDVDDLFLGADARFGIAEFPVDLGAGFDYYFVGEGVTLYQINLNAYYPFFGATLPFVPYAGAGIGITRMSVDLGEMGEWFGQDSLSSSDTGINLIGGARFNAGSVLPYLEAKLTIGDLDLFTIGGGLLIRIGN